MTPNLVLWIYVALLLAGGLVGFLKAGSKVSLGTAVAFAVPIALEAASVVSVPRLADLLIGALLLFFGVRWAKTRRFLPAGLMALASAAALALRWLVLR